MTLKTTVTFLIWGGNSQKSNMVSAKLRQAKPMVNYLNNVSKQYCNIMRKKNFLKRDFHKWRHPFWWHYFISIFSKIGDKGEGGVKNLKKWVMYVPRTHTKKKFIHLFSISEIELIESAALILFPLTLQQLTSLAAAASATSPCFSICSLYRRLRKQRNAFYNTILLSGLIKNESVLPCCCCTLLQIQYLNNYKYQSEKYLCSSGYEDW